MFGGNLGCDPLLSKKAIASNIFQFEQEIDEWNNALPDFLRTISSSSLSLEVPEDPLSTKFRIILTLRCLNLQVLLYRPVFNGAIDRSSEAQAQTKSMRSMDHMEANHIQSSLSSAKEIIDIVYGVITSQNLGRHFLGAWWFSLYYGRRCTSIYSNFEVHADEYYEVFNAALMIFGSLLVSPRHTGGADISDQTKECKMFLARAIQALHELDEDNVTVQRCAEFLNQMSYRLDPHRDSIYNEDPMNTSTADFSISEGEAEGTRMVRFMPDPHLLDQANGGPQISNIQTPSAINFMYGGVYGDELEFGQFFLGSYAGLGG